MKDRSHTSCTDCSGAKIIRIPRGRQRVAPKMDRTLPEVGDVILYNEKLSDGMRTRGYRNLEKRGCMHVTLYALNDKALFEPYTLVDANGKVNCKHNDATAGYIVVSKDFEHPK